MLQQTQVPRVVSKFNEFITEFPDVATLANAPLGEVLKAWLGLGYNRRARFLHEAAQKVARKFGGELPRETSALETLPGVGANTAGAIRAYAFNQPAVFIETNIRTVFIHHFFEGKNNIADKAIFALVADALPGSHYREWYWALMDYGTYLKMAGNNVGRSRHYKKQSTFQGSQRQMRGELLRHLQQKPYSLAELKRLLPDDARVEPALQGLVRDGLVVENKNHFQLTV